jgi:CO dehydrogenase/acetyl-CoA synthase delta subunit
MHHHTFALIVVAAVSASIGTSAVLRAHITTPPETITVEIGIEHTAPVSLSLAMSTLKGKALLDLTQESGETIFISLPENWERREVRNVSLHEVAADLSTFGFKRWRLPAGAAVSFTLPIAPDSLILHNPSQVPLKVSITRVDLETSQVTSDVILVQDSPVELW